MLLVLRCRETYLGGQHIIFTGVSGGDLAWRSWFLIAHRVV